MKYGQTQEEEMKLAAEQKRQPIYVYCKNALDIVIEYQERKIVRTTVKYCGYATSMLPNRLNKGDNHGAET